jgi:hypothetical protein
MNVTLLQAGDDGRYGEFHIDDGDLIVSDRENPTAWVRIEDPAAVET